MPSRLQVLRLIACLQFSAAVWMISMIRGFPGISHLQLWCLSVYAIVAVISGVGLFLAKRWAQITAGLLHAGGSVSIYFWIRSRIIVGLSIGLFEILAFVVSVLFMAYLLKPERAAAASANVDQGTK